MRERRPGSRRPARGRPSGPAGPRREASPTQARLLAARILERVERAGAYADLSLHAALRATPLAAPERAHVTDLVYGTLRWRGELDHLLGQLLDRDPASLEPLVSTLLRLGAYQIVHEPRTPVSAAVDQTVRCARALGADRAAGLVNAVLRRLAREAQTLPVPSLAEDPLGHLEHALSLPRWIAERWLARLGPEAAAALARASNAPPPVVVRANRRRIGRDALLAQLRERIPDAAACAHAPDGILLGHAGPPGEDPAFRAGLFTVQDEASQLVVELLDPQPGEQILDLCAAPGTKTTAIAERLGDAGRVLACDRNGRRLALVERAARRLGLTNVAVRTHDGATPLPDAAGGPFDRVLVDAPCSGLGTLRRNPDARWRVGPDDPARLAALQRSLLRSAVASLRPGGTLVYSTCTLLEEENEAVLATLLAERDDLSLVPRSALPARLAPFLEAAPGAAAAGAAGGRDAAGGVILRTWPHRDAMDGFFAARLERTR